MGAEYAVAQVFVRLAVGPGLSARMSAGKRQRRTQTALRIEGTHRIVVLLEHAVGVAVDLQGDVLRLKTPSARKVTQPPVKCDEDGDVRRRELLNLNDLVMVDVSLAGKLLDELAQALREDV